MVQVAVDEVVDVVPMRDRLVTAVWPMSMRTIVAATRVIGRAVGGIAARNGELVLVDVVAVHVVKMAIVQIVDVLPVADRGVTAAGAVVVIVVLVGVAAHGTLLLSPGWPRPPPCISSTIDES
jgi:hypothetical protein